MHYKLQLILYYRSKTKHCQRLLEDDLATECYSNSNVDQLNGRRKGSVFYVLHSYKKNEMLIQCVKLQSNVEIIGYKGE